MQGERAEDEGLEDGGWAALLMVCLQMAAMYYIGRVLFLSSHKFHIALQ